MTQETVSIIIPVYNGENTIEHCLDSIFNQNYQDFKVYVINDGSTDQTAQILERYNAAPRLEVIHQSNTGVSAARNKGLEVAQGVYISFVDADDTVEPNHLEVLMSGFEHPDVSLSVASYHYIDVDRDETKVPVFELNHLPADQSVEYMMSEVGPEGYLWNKLFLANPIKSHQLIFDSEIFMAEDLLFVVHYLILAGGKTIIDNSPIYNYMVYANSSNKTRLSTLEEGYKDYYDNFLYCTDKMVDLLPVEFSKGYKAVQARKGRLAIQYLRALALMSDKDQELRRQLRQLAKTNRSAYFSSLDGHQQARAIYLMVLYAPRLALWRDKKHYGY